jgi:hypothetical protein
LNDFTGGSVKRFLLLILLISAHRVFACGVDRFSVRPTRPTVADVIEVVLTGACPDGCIPRSPRVSVAEGTITIDLINFGGCILVPSRWGERVEIGQVPAGTYAVIVKNNDQELARQTLVVREPPLVLMPSFGTAGTTVLIRQREITLCDTHPCALPTVRFGGVQATSVALEGDGLAVVAPEHARRSRSKETASRWSPPSTLRESWTSP